MGSQQLAGDVCDGCRRRQQLMSGSAPRAPRCGRPAALINAHRGLTMASGSTSSSAASAQAREGCTMVQVLLLLVRSARRDCWEGMRECGRRRGLWNFIVWAVGTFHPSARKSEFELCDAANLWAVGSGSADRRNARPSACTTAQDGTAWWPGRGFGHRQQLPPPPVGSWPHSSIQDRRTVNLPLMLPEAVPGGSSAGYLQAAT